MSTLATYTEWIGRGRSVRKKERAATYAVEPDGAQRRVALFDESQTEELAAPAYHSWPLVAADELPSQDHRRTLRLDLTPEGFVRVWCGPDKYMIDLLQRKGWKFERGTARWIAPHKNAAKTLDALEAQGYNVLHEADV